MKHDKHDKHEHDKQITIPICSIMTVVCMAQVFFAIGKKDEREFRLFLFLSRVTRGHDFSSDQRRAAGLRFICATSFLSAVLNSAASFFSWAGESFFGLAPAF